MATYTFVKKGGAPAGTIHFTLPGGDYVIDDSSNTTLVTTNEQHAADLRKSPYLNLQGTSGSYVPPPAVEDAFLADGVLSRNRSNPTPIMAPLLAAAANPDVLIVGTITRDANGAATAASVVWPDGATGAYTATTVNSTFPGAVDAYTITRVVSGTTTTFTQPLVTRDSSGAVTNRPAITVS